VVGTPLFGREGVCQKVTRLAALLTEYNCPIAGPTCILSAYRHMHILAISGSCASRAAAFDTAKGGAPH
jgi:hypothetical protein